VTPHLRLPLDDDERLSPRRVVGDQHLPFADLTHVGLGGQRPERDVVEQAADAGGSEQRRALAGRLHERPRSQAMVTRRSQGPGS
jgi:hypothetical protein